MYVRGNTPELAMSLYTHKVAHGLKDTRSRALPVLVTAALALLPT